MLTEVSFGEWLKRQRNTRGLNREQLAHQIGCAVITLRKIEAEERHPSTQIVDRLAEIFDVPQNERTAFLRFARGDWQSAPTGSAEDFPWQTSSKSPRTNLPARLTALIGREKEIALVQEYLSNGEIRLVTLVGPPGIGKTRLSLEVARLSLPNFPDGVFFVTLAPLDDPVLIAPTIVKALEYVKAKKQSDNQKLVEGIGEKQILIVLDNCEHLIQNIAELVSGLLSACSHLKIIATSREALRIHGEWLYPVPTLDVPRERSFLDPETASEFSALTLFAERARAVSPDFVLQADNIQAVASICAQLDGLPLAIELIAARVRLMPPQTLLTRLSDQFVLYADGMRALATRQKTLHNAIDWSYSLLTAEEQNLFVRLSVFSGGFTLPAAETIFSRILTEKLVSDLITSLLDKSMLQRTLDSEAHSEPRFHMLMTIKQFALDRLRQMGVEAEMRGWHLAFFLDLAEQADKEIHGPTQIVWINRLELEHDNFRAALDWGISNQQTELSLRLFNALCLPWLVRNHYSEILSWFDKIQILPEIRSYTALYARPLNFMGRLNWLLADFRKAQSFLNESEALWLKLGVGGE